MPLSVDDLTEIQGLLAASASDAGVVAELRRRFPSLSLTRCDASDVTETPFAVYDRFELHLVDTVDHCATLTLDPSRATGLVLAQRKIGT